MGNKIWEKDWAIKLFLVGEVAMWFQPLVLADPSNTFCFVGEVAMWFQPLVRGPSKAVNVLEGKYIKIFKQIWGTNLVKWH